MPSDLQIGVVGLGRLGSLYASYFARRIPGARLHAVSDVLPAAVDRTVRETGARGYRDYHELIADPQVAAIVVVTPTRLHGEVVLAAAAAKKPIFCEKPLSLDLQEAATMADAVAKSGTFFQLGFMRRFDRAYAAAHEKITAGVIGRPIVFKASSRDQFPPSLEYLRPANSGGLFIDMGIHDFDLARWFMGEVRSVYAAGGALADPAIGSVGDIDNGLATLTFEDGDLGFVSLSRNGVYGYAIDTEIVGTEGTIQIGYDRETAIAVKTRGNVAHDTVPGFYERFAQAYVTQLENFVDNVRHDRTPPIGCADGIAAQKIALAATRSLHSQRVENV